MQNLMMIYARNVEKYVQNMQSMQKYAVYVEYIFCIYLQVCTGKSVGTSSLLMGSGGTQAGS